MYYAYYFLLYQEPAEEAEAMDTTESSDATVDMSPDQDSDPDTLTWLLGELLDKYVSQTQPSVRQVWYYH